MNNITVDVSGALDLNLNNGLSLEDTDPIYVNVKGDIMHGNLNMNKHLIQNVSKPEEEKDAVNKKYVDNIVDNIQVILINKIQETSTYLVDKYKNLSKILTQ